VKFDSAKERGGGIYRAQQGEIGDWDKNKPSREMAANNRNYEGGRDADQLKKTNIV
jgi:hypothetical protein